MFLQTLLLALTEPGQGSCAEVSISGYPEIVRPQLAWQSPIPIQNFPANKLHAAREPIGENVVFLDSQSEKTKFDTFRAELLHREKCGTPMYVSVSS
jgi:hypothetical protein